MTDNTLTNITSTYKLENINVKKKNRQQKNRKQVPSGEQLNNL